MGVRLNSTIVFGVSFTSREVNAYEKFMKDKPQHWFLMRYVEETLKTLNKSKDRGERGQYKDHLLISYFIKVNKKTHRALQPFRPFWAGWSQKDQGMDLFDSLNDYQRELDPEAHCKDNFMWWPQNNHELQVGNIFGYVLEKRYASEIDYALMDILDLRQSNRTYTIKGSRPWECGIALDERKKTWYTFHDSLFMPYDLRKNHEADFADLGSFKGTKTAYLKYKKDLWDKYHGTRKPYKIYPGDGWYGTDYYYYPVDMLFKFMSKHIPEIKYDVMRLEKFLCFYWS